MTSYVLTECSDGGSSFRSYLPDPGALSVRAERGSEDFVSVSIPDSGAGRDGLRLEMDLETARTLSRTLSRELTAWRKRTATNA